MTAVHLPMPTLTPTLPRSQPPRRDNDVLRTIAKHGARELGSDASAEEVARWASETFGDRLAVASSMQDAVLPHLVSRFARGVDVLFLDTGYHFSDTLITRDIVAEDLPVNVVSVRPELTVAEQDERYGARLYERDPAHCCAMRKVAPLARTLPNYEAWATGVRREESAPRSRTALIAWDDKNGLVKINPLAAWTFDDVVAYQQEYDVEVNSLFEEGYPSIGCEPCTRRVAPGEDPRSGRWAGFAKTECGLHE